MADEEHPAVTNFRNYIRIKTVQPTPDYATCTTYLQGQAKEIGAECQVVECVPGKPAVIMTLPGEDPTLPAVLLNSHTDVVPVFPEHWKYDPFGAHKDEAGDIYGRGTQDMKCVGIQYLEALKRLKAMGDEKGRFLRSVHLSFVPEEELGGLQGMGRLVQTETFRRMNVGVALDEGYASTSDAMKVFYGQRNPWWILIKCPGQPGHGSQFLQNTAGEKLAKIINFFMAFREQELRRLEADPSLTLGDVTTINLTKLEGGVQFNVVPAELSVGFDVRIPPGEIEVFQERLDGWCKEAGGGITCEFGQKVMEKAVTCVEDGRNPWWDAFSSACKKMDVVLEKEIFPASTDMKYIRKLGISALGFSPMNNTPILLHDHNEFLNERVFLRGVDIYTEVIPALANLGPW
ncbi:aminoacylase-1B-like [Penaeus indicus]|uniref:aminoacylase-1B-like n=1 Tax=Penaeus indicus TaxID=29960 RepID=UPI00300D4CB7